MQDPPRSKAPSKRNYRFADLSLSETWKLSLKYSWSR